MTRWSDEEEEFVREHWDEMTIEEIADELDRTYKSVRNKGNKIMAGKKKKQGYSSKKWTEDEEAFLEENWQDMKVTDLADDLDRSYSSVRYKSQDLDLPPKDQVREGNEPWDDDEENFLKDNWEEMTLKRLAKELDRSIGSVRAKANYMALPKKIEFDYWSEDEEDYLKENYGSKTVSAIADDLDRTEDSIEAKARKMGALKYSDQPVEEKEHEFTTANHKINIDGEELKLIPLGDIHLGHPATDEEALFDLLDNLKEGDVPYRIILMGDLWEGATTESPNFQFTMKYPPQKQYQNVLAIFEEFSDKILGAVVGNHEDFARNITGYQKMKDFCREIDVPFLKYTGAINLTLNDIHYQIVATHGSTGSRTWGGRINALTRMNDVVPDADLYLYSHTHSRAAVTDAKYRSIADKASKKRRTYVLTGSFMNYPGTYADKKNYPPTSLGIVPVTLKTNKKELEAKI